MTRAVLLAFLTLCSARVSVVTAGAQTPVTCSPGKVDTHIVNQPAEHILVCPQNYQMLVMPAQGHPDQAAVYTNPDVLKNEVKALGEVLPGAGFLEKTSKPDKTYTFNVTQLPPQAVTVYFPCQGHGQNLCYIGMEVQASPRLGPNTCAALGTQIDFTVEKENETVQFACGEKKTMHPSDPKKALDENCTSEVALFDGATLTGDKQTYQLAVQKLPSKTTKICYLCVKKGDDLKERANRCEVRIAIKDAIISDAVGVAARTAAAVGLCLSAIAGLRMW